MSGFDPIPHFDPEHMDDDDQGFMSAWYDTIDRAEEHRAEMGHHVAETESVLPPAEREKQRETFLDMLRRYLTTSAGLDNIPDPEPLIRQVLYLDSLAWIVGRPGAGKSLVALDWAGHIGAGMNWCGFPTRRGNVVYVSPESPGGIKLRVRAWESAIGQPMENVYFLPVAVQAAADAHWQALMALCHEKDPVMVVLDTQARVTLGLEENSAKDMGLFVDKLERLRDATKACVLIVHHTPRGGTHVRGSTALEGAASTIVTCVKQGDVVTLAADPEQGGKTKDVAPFTPVELRLTEHRNSVVLTTNSREGHSSILTTPVRAMLARWWEEHEGDAVSVSLLVRTEIFVEATFHRIKKPLIREGLIVVSGTGRNTRYALTRQP